MRGPQGDGVISLIANCARHFQRGLDDCAGPFGIPQHTKSVAKVDTITRLAQSISNATSNGDCGLLCLDCGNLVV